MREGAYTSPVLIKTNEVQTGDMFSTLFPRNQLTVEAIAEDMRQFGYDLAFPLVMSEGGKCDRVLIDGHTRLEAAKKAGIKEVPVFLRTFDSEDEALMYAIHCQKNRRNLTDAEIVRIVRELDKRNSRGGDRTTGEPIAPTGAMTGRTSETTAKLLGVSPRTVERARTVNDHADAATIKAVEAGETSLNKAYNQTVEARRGTPEPSQTVDEKPDPKFRGQVTKALTKFLTRWGDDRRREVMAIVREVLQ